MRFLRSHFLGAQRNGVNLVEMNLGDFDRVNGPRREGVADANYPVYPVSLFDWMQNAERIASVRLLFTWEAVQSTPLGPVPPPAGAGYASYWADLLDVLSKLLARGIYVTLAPWQYNSNIDHGDGSFGDTDIVYDDGAFSSAQFADFWGKFAAQINAATGGSQRVAFELMNEPHEPTGRPGEVGITTANWFGSAQAAITSIRAVGAANTILVAGMNFADPQLFVANSAAGWLTLNDPIKNIAVTVHQYNGLGSTAPNVLSATCAGVVAWARGHDLKVHVGEIAIDAGSPTGSLATAQAQWADWNRFCVENADVIVGWNWWAASESDWWDTGDSSAGSHWGLTTSSGASVGGNLKGGNTVYMDLVESTVPVPRLVIRDNAADTSTEPNVTTAIGWESGDIQVSQGGGAPGVEILGGSPSTVQLTITNAGGAPYAPAYGHVVRLYWAKASAGLGWPAPWDGSQPGPPKLGAPFGAAAVPALAAGAAQTIQIDWPDTPKPDDYPVKDGHFCLLAWAVPPHEPEFDGFASPNLNVEVLKFSHVAWRNIHITAVGARKVGSLVLANASRHPVRSQVSFDVLDAQGRPLPRDAGVLLITPSEAALERIRQSVGAGALEPVNESTFRVVDTAAGIPRLALDAGESLAIELAYAQTRDSRAGAIRAIQSVDAGDGRIVVGGQTFVVGRVAGINSPKYARAAAGKRRQSAAHRGSSR